MNNNRIAPSRGRGGGRGMATPDPETDGSSALVPRSRARGSGEGQAMLSQRGGGRLKMTVVSPETERSRAVGTQPAYGEIVDSDFVHDEIRELGEEVKKVVKTHFQRHGTSEAGVVAGIRQFGPSRQAKKMLNKENEAARFAHEKDVYVVWRLMEKPRLSGANNDFCCRVGPRHRCFCGHTLANHKEPTAGKGGSLTQKHPCKECECKGFIYVPNEPEEIGEGWLTRRANWDPSKWSAKCRCEHGNLMHDPATKMCRSCGGCCGYQSHFLCVVCDMPWEAHMTVFETEAERHRAGFPVRQDFFPLANIDWDVRELVLKDVTGGGALEAPPDYEMRRLSARGQRSGGGGKAITANPRVEEIPHDSYAVADYCPSCATIYKDNSDTCGRCGRQRPGRLR